MNKYTQVAILIPSLSPCERLIKIVEELKQEGFYNILIVNDGSDDSYNSYYTSIEKLGATTIRHAVNLGKGRALKTGMNYILNQWPACVGVVTADSDGQHSVADIIKCSDELLANPEKLILGSRNFREENIPFKSRFGNIITSKVLDTLVGMKVEDTQTGLRAFSSELMKRYLIVKGEYFEYEMNMLLFSKEENISVISVPIETIYLENNKSSHFRPFKDSIKIYSLFLKFLIASVSSWIIDIVLFSIAISIFRDVSPLYYIIISTVIARAVSSMWNFALNRRKVFKSNDNLAKVLVKYYLLAIVQMSLSAMFVWWAHEFTGGNETGIKILVDILLFVLSFQIQREWVFKNKN